MISPDTFSINWITVLSNKYRNADKILIEKIIWVFHLLELLHLYNLKFIFKGGTSLLLLLDSPKRFSIDIDIVITEKPSNLNKIFKDIIDNSDFIKFEKDERIIDSNIEIALTNFIILP